MADLNSLRLGPPDKKKIRLDPLGSDSSDVIGNLLDDLGDELPVELLGGDYDPSSLANDSNALLNSNVGSSQLKQQSTPAMPNAQQQQQQNALNTTSQLPQSTQGLPPSGAPSVNSTNQPLGGGSNLSTSQSGFNSTSNATGSGIAANNTASSQPGGQLAPPAQSAPQVSSNSGSSPNPNTTINMYPNTNSNLPNSSMNSRFAASLSGGGAGAPSPQPTSISTSGDPTPTLPSVSSSPAHNIAMSSSGQWNSSQRSFAATSNSPSSLAMSMSGGMTMTTQSSMNPLASSMTGPSQAQIIQQQRMVAAQQHGMGMQHAGMGPMRVSHPQAAMGMGGMPNQMMRVNQASMMGHHPSMGMTHGHMGMMQQANMHHGQMGMQQAHYMRYSTMHMQPHQMRGHMGPGIRTGQPTIAGGMHPHMNPHMTQPHHAAMRSQMAQSQMMHRPPSMMSGGYPPQQNSMMGQQPPGAPPPHGGTMLTAGQPQMQTAGPPTPQQVQHVQQMSSSPQQQQLMQSQQAQQQQQQMRTQQMNVSPISQQQQQARNAPTPPIGGGGMPGSQQSQQQQQQLQASVAGGGATAGTGGSGGSGAPGGAASSSGGGVTSAGPFGAGVPQSQAQAQAQAQQQQQTAPGPGATTTGGAAGGAGGAAMASTQPGPGQASSTTPSMGGSGQAQMPGTPQNPASNKAVASITTAQQQSTPPTASTGSVGGHQVTPGSSLADITPSLDSSGTSLPSSQPQTPQQQQNQPPRQNITPTPPNAATVAPPGAGVLQNPQTPQHQQQQQQPSSQPQSQQQQQQGLSMSANVPTPPPPGQQQPQSIGGLGGGMGAATASSAVGGAGGFGGALSGLNNPGGRPFPGAPGASLSPGQQPGAGQTSDPEKRKQIQQQLVLLLHAHKCQRREREQQASGDYRPCTLPHCKTMKNVLNHMTECQAGRSCTYPHCASSRQIIAHWKNCQRTDCPVCLPLKHASLAHGGKRPEPGGQAPGANVGMSMGNTGSNMGMGHGAAGMGMGPGGSSQFPGNMNIMGGPQASGGFNHMMQGGGMGHPGQVRNMYGMSQQPGGMRPGGYPAGPMGNPMGGPPGMQRKTSYPLPIPPIVSQPTQPWHDQVNPDLRQHLVKKLVEAIYPVHDPLALQDTRVHSLVQYAMKVEKVMFEAATNREEYYKLLAQKIYHIRKELEDRKNQKKPGASKAGAMAGGMVNGDPSMQQPGFPFNFGGGPEPGAPGGNAPSSSSAGGALPGASGAGATSGGGSGGAGQFINSPHQSLAGSGLDPFAGPSSVNAAANFSPRPVSSVESKQDIKQTISKLLSPTSGGFSPSNSQNQASSDPLFQSGGLPSLPSLKSEPLTSPTFGGGASGGPTSIPNPPQSQSIKTELNSVGGSSGADMSSALNVPDVPPLPESIPSVPNTHTPAAVSSVKAPGSMKRQNSISFDNQQQPSSNRPGTPMDSEAGQPIPTPKPPPSVSRGSKVVPDPTLRKVFSGAELENAFRHVFDLVWSQDPESFPFRQPVDPKLLGIPDYFEIIKNPIDLSTIDRRLAEGSYKDGWEFCDDMRLMFDNAWLYNRKTSRVYKYCTKLSEVFESNINVAMRSLGYCCGEKHMFNPQVLYCYGKPLCTIPRDSTYYGYQNRYVYCPKCFSEITSDKVTVGDDPLTATVIMKSVFKEMKNDSIDREPMVSCIHCGRRMHTICVLHMDQIYHGGFQCDECLRIKGQTRKENKFSAKRLPTTKLATFLEDRINGFLQDKVTGTERQEVGHITIRVVSSSDKTLETRMLMKERFGGDYFPSQFPYRTKAMFVFEEIEGVDVCFFGMHVQEYGSDCQAPNTRRVYISYLDSVHFFRPRAYRTDVYHEILIGYLEFCKNNGFLTAHIWACPPSEGDDYIFHCHPAEQKVPKPKRLVDWYKKMLDKGKSDSVVYEYRDLFKHSTDCGYSVTDIPYFEGDFWPNIIEETIKELDQEAKEREAEASSDGRGPKRPDKRNSNKKGSKKASGTRSKSSKKGGMTTGGDDLTSKIYQTMEKHKEVFFVVLLHPPAGGNSSPPPGTTDPDQLVTCDLMDGRDAFLTMARERHWEFSSLRRAKFSTMAMLFELHNQSSDRFVYNCNNCHMDVETRYHCKECDDFDMCVSCYQAVGHEHPMDKLGLGLDDEASFQEGPKDPREQRKASIEKCIRYLVHATKCHDPHCKLPSCIKMKRVLTHSRECKLMLSNKWSMCKICKQFVLLCISHAKNCNEDKCPVPVCARIKKNLRDQRNKQAVQRQRFMQMRMAHMSASVTNQVASVQNTNNNVASPAANSSPSNPTSHPSPSKGSPANHPASHTANNSPAAGMTASPAGGNQAGSGGGGGGGKGGPRTPASEQLTGKAPRLTNVPSPAMQSHPSSVPPSGKMEQNMPAPNVTVGATAGLPGELKIQKVPQNPAMPAGGGPGMQQRMTPMMGRAQHEMMGQNSPAAAAAGMGSQYQMNMGTMAPQSNPAMMRHPNYVSPVAAQQMMAARQSQYGGGSYRGIAPNMQPHMAAAAAAQQQRMMSQGQVYHQAPQQRSSQLQQMLAGPPTQQYAAAATAQYPQMSAHPHMTRPPPQYPMPQTAGYPQVLGQSRPMAGPPAQMGQHMPNPQMHHQYGGGMAQMDPSGGMQPSTADPSGYMYQQQHQYGLNTNNNNSFHQQEPLGSLGAMTPTDRLSRFAESL